MLIGGFPNWDSILSNHIVVFFLSFVFVLVFVPLKVFQCEVLFNLLNILQLFQDE